MATPPVQLTILDLVEQLPGFLFILSVIGELYRQFGNRFELGPRPRPIGYVGIDLQRLTRIVLRRRLFFHFALLPIGARLGQ